MNDDRCHYERLAFYQAAGEATGFELQTMREWDALRWPYLCTGWEVLPTATYDGKATLGLCRQQRGRGTCSPWVFAQPMDLEDWAEWWPHPCRSAEQ
jgi:hypothetical protein